MNDVSSEPGQALAERCRETADAAVQAAEWFADAANGDKVGAGERPAKIRLFRRLAAEARRLERAVQRPMCAGVFGPSQAGKSYLVSVLARPGDRRLMAVFEGQDVDFIERINPEGGRESTGLVTRFSLRGQPHPPGFPVCLRLLSQVDVVKILGNSFFFDSEHDPKDEPDGEAIRSLLAKARNAAQPAPVDGLRTEDVWDVQDYFDDQFMGVPYCRALKPFWEEAAELAPRLRPADRAELFAVLWGGHAPFTALYRTLVEALGQLGFADQAFCPLEPALIPRETSIIDVAMLAGLGQAGQDALAIRAMNGPEIRLPRPVITALTAELRIVLKERPWPFFEHTDLLDFPGARSRQPLRLAKYFQEKEDALAQTFLRGKVAYLFDRYVAEHELNSMLLCIDEKNQEVVTLPNMIDGWIARSHGKTPADRAKQGCVLFFVLTKFDMHFSAKAGEDPASYGTRFANRLQTSLLGFFGKVHDWPKEWTPGRPFRNCFWLRNPNYPADAIIVYDESKREVRFREDRTDYIAQLEAAYLDVEQVREHFGGKERAERAWTEALKLNDGGVSFLADALAPVCNPEMKREQIVGQLADISRQMIGHLEPFYVPDDLDARLAQRRAVADAIVDELYRAADFGRFGYLLRAMQVAAGDVADVLYRAELQPVTVDGEAARVVAGARPSGERLRPGMPNRPVPGARPAPVATEPPRPQPVTVTRERMLANAALRHWTQMLYELRGSTRACHQLELAQKNVGELVDELTAAARRTGLDARIAAEIKRLSYIEKADVAVHKSGLLAATLINRFVDQLGFDQVPPAQRPQVGADGDARPVFAPQPTRHDALGLGEEPEPFTDRFLTDWAFAFYRLVEENASMQGGRQIDAQQNARLGLLIQTLSRPL
jgi:hypothetical protein